MPHHTCLRFGVGLHLAGCRAVCGKGISNIVKPRSKADMLQPCILQMYMRMRAKHSLPPLAVLAAFSWAFCRAIAVFCALPPPCFNIHSEASPKARVCHALNDAALCSRARRSGRIRKTPVSIGVERTHHDARLKTPDHTWTSATNHLVTACTRAACMLR